MTPCTPSISHLYALEVKLAEIEQEGIAKRHDRHRKNAERGRAWLQANGFGVFPEKGYSGGTHGRVGDGVWKEGEVSCVF